MKNRFAQIVITGMSVFLVAACMNLGSSTSPGTKLYLLEPSMEADGTTTAAPLPDDFSLGVGPVTVAQYLNRPNIVTRTGGNEVEASEFHQWAEPLRHGISRVLNENLALLTKAGHVHAFPWKRSSTVDIQVAVKVLRFDADAGGVVTLNAQWFLYGENGKHLIRENRSSFTRDAGGAGYGNIVSAMSQALGDLSREIADAVSAIESP